MTLLVLAHPRDDAARRFARCFSERPAAVIGPRELSTSRWEHYAVGPGDDVLSLGERPLRADAVSAVLVRIAAVSEHDLVHIGAEDRRYVAAEMTAFLWSFLSRLRCPVVNRPGAGSLMGPGWSATRWAAMAARAGLPPASDALPVGSLTVSESEAERLLTVVGDEVVGAPNRDVACAAVKLARAAAVRLLPIRLRIGPRSGQVRFVAVEPWSDVAVPEVAALLYRELAGETLSGGIASGAGSWCGGQPCAAP